MKSVDKKKQRKAKKPSTPKQKEKIRIVAHEFTFARLLAGNEKKSRDRVLKALKKWLINSFEKKYEFKEDDFVRVWKGLFYAVWMSDKPLIQEELCESIAETLDLFPVEQYEYALLMMKAGLRVLATEWYGIDQHRMDKFMMLVRRYLRGCLRTVGRQEWSVPACTEFADMLAQGDGLFAVQTPAYARNAISLLMHVCDCFLEELAKTSLGNLPPASLTPLLSPFLSYLSLGRELRVSTSARQMLNQLIRQTDEGLEYDVRRRAWEQMGCPEGGPDALEKESDDDDEKESVDDDEDDDIYEALSRKEYPLKISLPSAPPSRPSRAPPARRAARALVRAERQLMSDPTDMAIRGLGRKHRKRLLAKSRAGQSIVEELSVIAGAASDASTTNGNWHVEDASPPKKDSSDKENQHQQRKTNKRPAPADNTPSPPKKLKLQTQTNKETPKTLEKQKKNKKKQPKLKITIRDKSKTKEAVKNDSPKDKPKKQKEEKTKLIPLVVVNKVKNYQKQTVAPKKEKKIEKSPEMKNLSFSTPKKVKFVLKNNSMQETMDYYKSVRQSPNIPYDGTKKPTKTNLKPNSTPSPINPFFNKKRLRLKN